MAENTANQTNVDNTEGAHDRVVMLSLRADGTPDQINPEIIGDVEFAKEAAQRQFAEQAVSAADEAKRSKDADAAKVKQDPSIEATQKEHDKIAAAAERKAAATVDALKKD